MLKPLIPIKLGTWPAAMLIAEPVIKADIATSGMRSTIQPTRINPMKMIIQPAITAKAEAMTCDGISGSDSLARSVIWPGRKC